MTLATYIRREYVNFPPHVKSYIHTEKYRRWREAIRGQKPTQVASEAAEPNTSIFKWPVQPELPAFSLPSMGVTTVEFTTMTENMAVKIMDDFELAQKAIFVLMSGAHSTEERDGFRIVSYTCSRWQEKQWEIQYEGPSGWY